MSIRTKSSTEASMLIPGLLDELALQCLARVPKLYHGALSAVSKPIRTAVSSPGFFETRSHLGVCDEVLIVQVRAPFQHSAAWFALYRTDKGNMVQTPLPPHPTSGLNESIPAAFGNSIYVFGGWTKDVATGGVAGTRAVWVLDCRSNTWAPGPSMTFSRYTALTAVLYDKIYVIGGALTDEEAFAEALNVSSGLWVAIPEPPVERSTFCLRAVEVDGGLIRVWGFEEELRFDPATWEWADPIPLRSIPKNPLSMCLLKGVLYAYDKGEIKRLCEPSQVFKVVEGAEQGLPTESWLGPRVVNVGDKLVVMAGLGAGRNLRWETIDDMRSNPQRWRFLTRDPFEVRISEIKVLEEEDGRVAQAVWSKNVLSLHWPDPPRGYPYPVIDTFVYLSDWNIFQVSL